MRSTICRLLLTALVLMLATIGGHGHTLAQMDLSKVLVGQWDGDVNIPRSRNPAGRTLVISSATEKDGVWAVVARWGVSGQGLAPVSVVVDTTGAVPTLSFVTSANSTIRVTIFNDTSMVGTFQTSGAATRSSFPLTLKKAQ